MRIADDHKLDFSDVLIQPKRSTLSSRSEVEVERTFLMPHSGREWRGFPLIAANMDTTGTFEMARALARENAMVALNKHYSADDLVAFLETEDARHSFVTVGTGREDARKLTDVAARTPVERICLDVANGYSEHFVERLKRLREEFPDATIMAGNVVTLRHDGGAGAGRRRHRQGRHRPGLGMHHAPGHGRGLPAALRHHRMRRRRARPQGLGVRRRAAAPCPATCARPMAAAPTS